MTTTTQHRIPSDYGSLSKAIHVGRPSTADEREEKKKKKKKKLRRSVTDIPVAAKH